MIFDQINTLSSYIDTQVIHSPMVAKRKEPYGKLFNGIKFKGQSMDAAMRHAEAHYLKTKDRSLIDEIENYFDYQGADAEVKGFMSATVAGEAPSIEGDNVWFTINAREEFTITGEVIGGNATISGLPQTVYEGDNMEGDVIIIPSEGYKIATARVYSGDEIDGDYDDTDGTNYKSNFYKSNGTYVLLKKFTNVTENKHIVITMETTSIIAQVVNVPGGTQGDLASVTSATGGYTILGHQYTSLEDALNDAQYVNDLNVNDLEGTVRIILLTDITDEINTIYSGNSVTLDLNGHTISIDNDANRVITIEDGASLTLVNSGSDMNVNTGKESEIVNLDGVSIYIKAGGELTLGVNDGRVSVATPTIEGETYGIYREEGGILNFYDGKVIGNTNSSIAGYIQNINTPELYKVSTDSNQETGREVAYVAIPSGIEAMIGTTEFMTLEDAFAVVENDTSNTRISQPTEIDVVATVTLEDAITLSRNKNVILDLNGNSIAGSQANNLFINNGILEIKDSSSEVQEYAYASLVDNGTYYFEQVDDHLEANNYGVASSTANSYIEIDLSEESSQDTFTLVVNANISSESSNDYGYLTITNSTTAPAATATSGRFAYVSGINIPTDYTTTLTGGSVYYLHLGYTKNASNDYYFDTFMINDITLNGESVIEELVKSKGQISNTLYGVITNNEDGDLTISGGKIMGKSTSNNVNHTTLTNYGDLSITGGEIYSASTGANTKTIRNLASAQDKTVTITGGIIYAATSTSERLMNTAGSEITLGGTVRTYEVISNSGNMTINNGKYSGVYYSSGSSTGTIHNYSNLIINGGKLASYYYGMELESNSNLIINGLNIESRLATIRITGASTTTINNANIESYGSNGIDASSGSYLKTITINNAQITATLDTIVVANNIQLTINDGTYISTGSSSSSNSDCAVNFAGANSYPGTVTLNGGTYTSTNENAVKYSGDGGTITLNGGTYISQSASQYTILNSSSNIINIGRENDTENTDVSQVNPTIRSNYYGISGEFNFYDGQIIAPVGNTIDGKINSIEEYDANGNKLDVYIEQITEDETNYDRMILAPAETSVARILMSSVSSGDLSNLNSSQYSDDGTYYYFNTIQDAVTVCSTSAGNTVTTIEILKDFSTVNTAEIEQGQNVKIDLKGHSVDFYTNEIAITNAGTLELADSVGGAGITTMYTALSNTGTVVTGIDMTNNEKVTYTSGGSSKIGVSSNKKMVINTGILTVNSGTITAYTATIIDNTGTFTLNDGTINSLKGNSSGLASGITNHEYGKCIINGGTVYCAYESYYYNSRVILNQDMATVKITGGTVQGSGHSSSNSNIIIYNTSESVYEEGVSEPSLYITGGTITEGRFTYGNSAENEVWIIKDANSNLTVSNLYNGLQVMGKLIIEGVTMSANTISNEGSSTTIKNSSTGALTVKTTESTDTIENSTVAGITKSNAGTLTVKSNSTISGAITNSGTGTIEIQDSSATTGITNSSSGQITIKNSTISRTTQTTTTGTITNTGTGTIWITDDGQTLITGTNANNNAIYNSGAGTITIGTKDGNVSTTYPRINGNKYGLYNSNASATINFYDGIIIGKTNQSIYGTVTDIEDGYDIVKTANGSTEEATLRQTVAVKILKTSINSANLTNITTEDMTDYYGFYSIQDAANACTDNQQTTAIVVRNLTYLSTGDPETIPANKDIILDVAGHNITSGKAGKFVNNGSLQIIDSSTEKTSVITSNLGTLITNNGTLELGEVAFSMTDTNGTSSSYVDFIVNNGNLSMEDTSITVDSNTRYINVINNTSNINIEFATITGERVNYRNEIKAIYSCGDVYIKDADFYASIVNYDDDSDSQNVIKGTIEIDDIYMSGGIINTGSSVYVENVSKPAVRINAGEIYNGLSPSNGIWAEISNANGEFIIGESGSVDTLFIGAVSTSSWITRFTNSSNGKVVVNSGTVNLSFTNTSGEVILNDGTIGIGLSSYSSYGDPTRTFTNSSEGTFRILGGEFMEKIVNDGTLIIGENDGVINTQVPMVRMVNTASTDATISGSGTFKYYDGTIKSISDVPVENYVTEIATNSEIIYDIYSSYKTYTLSTNTVVAKIGATEYYTLQSAIDACDSSTMKTIDLQKSIGVAEGGQYNLGNKKVTLNMNNSSIKAHCSGTLFTTSGEFTITDDSQDVESNIYSYGTTIVANTGALTIEEIGNMEILNTTDDNLTVISNTGTGTVAVEGGTITENRASISTYSGYGIKSTSTNNITITGGTISGGTSGSIYGHDYGVYVENTDTNTTPTIAISGGSISAGLGLYANNTTVNITGGEVSGRSDNGTHGGNRFINTTATMTGGTLSGYTRIDANSTLNISNSNATVANITNLGALTMTAGTVNGTITNSANATIENASFVTSGKISNSGTITIDSVQFNVTGSSTGSIITNTGTTTITNTSMDVTSSNSAILSSSGTVELKESTITTTGSYVIRINGGTFTIEDVTATTTSSSASSYGINVTAGTLTIPYTTSGGTTNETTIQSTNGYGIYLSGGTVTLGEVAYPVYTTYPRVIGGTYGVYRKSGTFNFYDGRIHGDTQAIYGAVADVPDQYSVLYEDETLTTAYLGIEATVENVVQVEGNNYSSITGAINAINNTVSKTGTIIFLKDITLTSPLTIPSATTITLDMQGHTLIYAGADVEEEDESVTLNAAIVNNGTLNIIDSLASTSTTVGYIENTLGTGIENNGTLTIGEDDGTLYTRAPRVIGGTYGVVNAGVSAVLNFYDGMIEGQTAPVDGTITTDTTAYTVTTGSETRTYGANQIPYITAYLVGNQ